jgi:hypothetical protein
MLVNSDFMIQILGENSCVVKGSRILRRVDW